jgi:hypothetical protein
MVTKKGIVNDPEPDDEVSSFEALLVRNLEPVRPRQEFVQYLHKRLATSPTINSSTPENSNDSLILIVVGLIGSLLVLIAGIRATLSILQARRTLRKSGI